MDMMGYMVKS